MDLLQVERTDIAKYNRIVAQLPFCDFNEDHWKFKAKNNTYFKGVLEYKKRKRDPYISDDVAIQVHRAMLAEPTLKLLMTPELRISIRSHYSILGPANDRCSASGDHR